MTTAKNPITSSDSNGGLTHFDEGGQAHMVDVGAKAETHRIAMASGVIRMKPETLAIITSGSAKKAMCSALHVSQRSWQPNVRVISYPCVIHLR